MKLIYHYRTLAADAQGIHVDKMIHAFADLGHKVITVALVRSSTEVRNRSLAWLNRFYRLIRASRPWLYEISALGYNFIGFLLLERAIRQFKPHFIYERYSLNTICGVLAAGWHRRPLVLEVNSPLAAEQDSEGKLFFKRIARFTERMIFRRAAVIIVVSDVLRRMLEDMGTPSTKLLVLHNGVDPNEFDLTLSGERIRARYGLTGATLVGFAGWFRKWHGLDALLEALDEDSLRNVVRLLLVGDGPAVEDLRQLVTAKHMEDMVCFTGPVRREEMAEHIAAMDIAVQPSSTIYACPMKIIEYMAMARCIVAPRQANILEILDDSSALLFEPGDVSSLRSAIRRAVTDSQLRHELGARAYQILRERGYYWTRNAERVITLLSEPSSTVSPGQKGGA